MQDRYKIAAVQMDVVLGDKKQNLERITERIEKASQQGARLVIFPECSVTGYCFDSLEEAQPFAESIPGLTCETLSRVCERTGVHVVCGLLEVSGEDVFNACVLVGSTGLVASYRKVHLPDLGVDRFTTPGNRPFDVHTVEGVRIGMNICYDSAFPESSRVLALQGADLVALPTNFPPGAECMVGHVINTRAMENKIYYAAVNRIGEERGFRFIGHSKICGVNGRTLAEAAHEKEEILYAEIDPGQARQKRIVRVPDKHSIDRFADRRPDMYGPIAES